MQQRLLGPSYSSACLQNGTDGYILVALCIPFYISCTNLCIVTTRKRSLGQGNIFAPVCHSVHRGRVPGQVHPTAGTPPGQVHPRAGAPPGQVHPQAGTPHWAGTPPWVGTPPRQVHPHPMVNARAVCILLECILVIFMATELFIHSCYKHENIPVGCTLPACPDRNSFKGHQVSLWGSNEQV